MKNCFVAMPLLLSRSCERHSREFVGHRFSHPVDAVHLQYKQY